MSFIVWDNYLRSKNGQAAASSPSTPRLAERDRVSAVASSRITPLDQSPRRLRVRVEVTVDDEKEPRSARRERERTTDKYRDRTSSFDPELVTAPYGTSLIRRFGQQRDIKSAVEVMKTLGKKNLLNRIHVNSFFNSFSVLDFARDDLLVLNDLISEFAVDVDFRNLTKWIEIHLHLNVVMDDRLSSRFSVGHINNPKSMFNIIDMLKRKDNEAFFYGKDRSRFIIGCVADVCFKAWLQKASPDVIEKGGWCLAPYFKMKRTALDTVEEIFQDVYNNTYEKDEQRARSLLRTMQSGKITDKPVRWSESLTRNIDKLLAAEKLEALR